MKQGHQAPKRYRINNFNSIEIKGDLNYCISHNFVYNCEEEEKKLYNAEPCYYTDNRFIDSPYNFYKNTKLYWTRWKNISSKSCIRRTLSCKNIPVGTLVSFNKSWYYVNKEIDNSYNFKVKKSNPMNIEFEISEPKYSRNFNHCARSQELTEALRANGFIVGVSEGNPNFLSSMLSTAAAYTGKDIETSHDDGQIAVAYGRGMMIGFSSGENTFRGYGNGCDHILYDFHNNFNKWSQCYEINKTTPIDEIIKTLKDVRFEEDLFE